jgi:hypothetical protein
LILFFVWEGLLQENGLWLLDQHTQIKIMYISLILTL